MNHAPLFSVGFPLSFSFQAIGENVKMLLPESQQASHDAKIANYLKTKQSNMIGAGNRLVVVKNGTVSSRIYPS
jgi:hypothetical protein